MTGAEAVRQINWDAINSGSPIPEQMPMGPSDEPLEAGFARQWIERVEHPNYPSWTWALEIVSLRRGPDDRWAKRMEQELRDIVRTHLPTGKNARVFCNAAGCLCYVERENEVRSVVYRELLLGQRGKTLGLKESDVDAIFHIYTPRWELTIVRHPKSEGDN